MASDPLGLSRLADVRTHTHVARPVQTRTAPLQLPLRLSIWRFGRSARTTESPTCAPKKYFQRLELLAGAGAGSANILAMSSEDDVDAGGGAYAGLDDVWATGGGKAGDSAGTTIHFIPSGSNCGYSTYFRPVQRLIRSTPFDPMRTVSYRQAHAVPSNAITMTAITTLNFTVLRLPDARL